ncbi:MAG TPA: transglutaminase domain-containing protein, partial [Bacteroidota bacterium]|nr:transglutaminase domain-containing protein [Bacteroidota bacterium]
KNDKERIRAIFRWITHNIAYDTKAFFSGELSASGGGNALKEKKAVCDGYAGLFEQVATIAGLEVEKISGFSKGYGFVAGGQVDARPNHAWNAVKLDGTWHLLDCTWGAGYVNDQKHYVRKLQEHYFLTPPEEFVYDHFPTDEKWQLLETPVTREQYENFVYLRPAFFWTGLKLVSHTNAIVKSKNELKVTLEAAPDALVLATLNQGEKKLDDTRIFSQRSGKTLEIRCSFPTQGAYTLRLFAKRKTDQGNYSWALDYRIDCDEGGTQQYPKAYAAFLEKDCFLFTPMNGALRENLMQEFHIRVAGAEKIAVIHAGKWTYLVKREDEFSGTAPVGKGDIQLAAKFPGQQSFQTLLSFSGQ